MTLIMVQDIFWISLLFLIIRGAQRNN